MGAVPGRSTRSLAVMRAVLAEFTGWVRWEQRSMLDGLEHPGIYLVARSPRKRKPSSTSKLLYIGETCGQTFHRRLAQFNRSAFLGKRAHSGGSTFARLFPQGGAGSLYISVLPVKKKEPYRSAYIRFVERAIIWNHVEAHGESPRCNRK